MSFPGVLEDSLLGKRLTPHVPPPKRKPQPAAQPSRRGRVALTDDQARLVQQLHRRHGPAWDRIREAIGRTGVSDRTLANICKPIRYWRRRLKQ